MESRQGNARELRVARSELRQLLNVVPNVTECHCGEPDPENQHALRFNRASVRDVRVHAYPVGLGVTDGMAQFFFDDENCGNCSVHADAMRDRPHSLTTATTARMLIATSSSIRVKPAA